MINDVSFPNGKTWLEILRLSQITILGSASVRRGKQCFHRDIVRASACLSHMIYGSDKAGGDGSVEGKRWIVNFDIERRFVSRD